MHNIFSNKIVKEGFSDHYAYFMLLKNNWYLKYRKRGLIRDLKNIDKKKHFETNPKSTYWNELLKLNLGNTSNSFEIFFETFSM